MKGTCRWIPWRTRLLAPIFRDARDMLLLTWAGVRAPSVAALDTAAALGRGIHKAEKDLTERLVTEPEETASLRLVPAHVERIGDSIEGLIRCCQIMASEGTVFTPRGTREVNMLFERAVEMLECAGDLTLTGNRVLARHVEIESLRFEDSGQRLRARPRRPAGRGRLPPRLVELVPGHPGLPARDHAPRSPDRRPHHSPPLPGRGSFSRI